MNNLKDYKDEKIQKRQRNSTAYKTTKIDFISIAGIIYLSFMAVYFGIGLDAPMWDFTYFIVTNTMALILASKLRKYEKKFVYVILITLYVLSIIYNVLFYIFEFKNIGQIAGVYFLIAVLLLIFNREKR